MHERLRALTSRAKNTKLKNTNYEDIKYIYYVHMYMKIWAPEETHQQLTNVQLPALAHHQQHDIPSRPAMRWLRFVLTILDESCQGL
jgi:hypothetical protein